jgi:translation initiation factor IF-2
MSDRVRIYELARKMNMPAQALIDACRELGYDVKSHSSTIDGHVVGLVIAHLGKKKEPAAKAEPKPTVAAKAPSGTKAAAKAAAPPPPVVKPRVLARYRKEPLPETVEPVAEASPAAPVVAPPVQPPAPVAPVAPVQERPAPVKAPVEPEELAPPAAHQPLSKAMLEQRAQLEAIERATARAKADQIEKAAIHARTVEEAAPKPPDKREAEPTRHPEFGKKAEKSQKGVGVEEPGDGTSVEQIDFRQGVPTAPSQPIRVGAPSFRATPPRPPKSHRNQPQEKHLQQQKKEEKRQAAAVVELPKVVAITSPMTVQALAEKMGQPETEVIKRLFMKGIMRTVNQMVELDLAKELAIEMGYELASQEDIDIAALVAAEEAAPKQEELTEEQKAALVLRPPVVTIMGHVDHGKTSLLDAIRQTKFLLTDSEHGGITQHIGAYHVEVKAEDGTLKQIVFLDTPGHEAFTAMRARGAKVTDIAILVVAADDGVMPQTVEAIDHAKAAGVPLIVAINKIDKSNADPDRVLTELMQHGVVPDKFGGETVTVNVSAKKRTGLDELLEMILLVADIQDLRANPDKPATGSIVEAELSRGKGPVATALVADGTLREGDVVVAGSVWGRVRALRDDRGEPVKAAGPSMPVELLGLKEVPQAGDRFEVVQDEQTARSMAEQRKEQVAEERKHHVTLESFHDMIAKGEVKELNIIVKADEQGPAEAIAGQLVKLSAKEVTLRVLRFASGGISETDVSLAASSNALIIGFNVEPDANARSAAEAAGVDIRTYNVLYQIVDEMQLAMQGLLQPLRQEVEVGTAEIRQLFKSKKVVIAGCMVTSGKIPRGALARIEREGSIVYEGKLDSLKRFKDDAREVAAGFECGMSFTNFNDVQEGDIVHAFSITEVKRELTR